MKRFLHRLMIGETFLAEVQELLSNDEMIVAAEGDLLRVHNETPHRFKKGDQVTLLVKAVAPLRFQLMVDRETQKQIGKIDLSI